MNVEFTDTIQCNAKLFYKECCMPLYLYASWILTIYILPFEYVTEVETVRLKIDYSPNKPNFDNSNTGNTLKLVIIGLSTRLIHCNGSLDDSTSLNPRNRNSLDKAITVLPYINFLSFYQQFLLPKVSCSMICNADGFT